MGAKPPAKLKLRRPTYKCDICGRKLLSTQALKTHRNCVHKITDTTQTTAKKPATKPAAAVAMKKTAIMKVDVPKNVMKSTSDTTKPTRASDVNYSQQDVRKIEFECPKCLNMFPAYFTAYRHIQQYHCVNAKGQKVPTNSPDLIKPLRIELCAKCNERIISQDLHSCNDSSTGHKAGFALNYKCSGCAQIFASIQLFDLHVSGLHCDGVESMFFPNMKEFLMWKGHMESQTKINYLILGKSNTKQTYRCTFLPPSHLSENDTTAHICPSSIIVQEFAKGIQVHYYKQHFGHSCPKYELAERYRKYSITTLMQQAPGYGDITHNVKSDEGDLYIQFKTLMESIVLDAAKIKIESLKILVGKALEMTAILTNYDEDEDAFSYPSEKSDKNLSDDQITKALESIKPKTQKRKIDNGTKKTQKASKSDVGLSPKIVNAFSMASGQTLEKKEEVEPAETNKVNEPTPEETPLAKKLKNNISISTVQSPPSFNDSYKDFVDKNFLKGTEGNKNKETPVPRTRAGPELRTRSVRIEVQPMETTENEKQPTVNKETTSIKEKHEKQIQVKPIEELIQPVKEVAKPIKEKEDKPVRESRPKKPVVKTKMGQFKPSLSPKKSPEVNKSILKPKVDFEYEVKEQENDCNILILKI